MRWLRFFVVLEKIILRNNPEAVTTFFGNGNWIMIITSHGTSALDVGSTTKITRRLALAAKSWSRTRRCRSACVRCPPARRSTWKRTPEQTEIEGNYFVWKLRESFWNSACSFLFVKTLICRRYRMRSTCVARSCGIGVWKFYSILDFWNWLRYGLIRHKTKKRSQ